MNLQERLDDWQNTLATLGSVRDKATGITFGRRKRLRRRELESMYEQNPICARVVDKIADDAFREGWELIDHDAPDNFDMQDLMQRLQTDLHIDARMDKAVRWSRLYGGAILALGIIDGRKVHESIDPENIQMFFPPTVIVAEDAPPLTYDAAFGSPTYREVLSYQVSGLIATQQPILEIHHSRVVKFEPIELPLEARIRTFTENNGWGPSVLDRLFDDLGNEGSTRKHAVSMLYIASILYVKLVGLRDQLKQQGGEDHVRKVLSSLRANLDVLGLLGLDAEDDVASVQHTIQGLDRLIDKMRDALAAASDMPREILFNETPNGLRGGELSGAQDLWYATVGAFQEKVLTPALTRLLKLIFIAWRVPITKFSIRWKPLFTKSDETVAETQEKNSRTDETYHRMGVLSAGEIRQQRFVDGNLGQLDIAQEDAGQTPGGSGTDILPALEIVKAVAAGEIPRDAGAQLLLAAGFSPMLLGSAGQGEASGAGVPAASQLPMPDDAMDIRDAAKRLGMHTRTLSAAIDRGELSYWGVGSRRSVSLQAVAELARAHEAAVGPPLVESAAE